MEKIEGVLSDFKGSYSIVNGLTVTDYPSWYKPHLLDIPKFDGFQVTLYYGGRVMGCRISGDALKNPEKTLTPLILELYEAVER